MVNSRSHYDVAHLHPLPNVPTKYQLPTPYGFWNIAWNKILYVKVTKARSNQSRTIMLHTYTP